MATTEKKLMLAFSTIFGEFELDFRRKTACFIRGRSLFSLITSRVFIVSTRNLADANCIGYRRFLREYVKSL